MLKHIVVGILFAAALLLVLGTGTVQAQGASLATDAPAPSASGLTSKGVAAVLGQSKPNNVASGSDEFLPPDEAFRFQAFPDGPDHVKLIWQIADGYYLYRSRIKATTTGDQAQLGALDMPKGETKTDEYFGKQEIYHHQLVVGVPVARASAAELAVPLKVTYQGCAHAGLCYPPITKEITVSLRGGAAGSGTAGPADTAASASVSGASATPGVSAAASASTPVSSASGASSSPGVFVSVQDRLVAVLRDGSLFAVLAFFFAAGVGLSVTPCVLPMVPILSGILAGEGANVTRWRGFSLSFTYVQGMALTYAGAGAGFVLVFKQAPQAFFQQPWIVALFVALFVALAFAMFGAYTLQMPSALQTRLADISNKQRSGTFVGCFIMGALSALVATACVAPALIAALTVISQTGEIARGAAALYATALGMGVPLLIVGASAGSLLPKAGPWMDTIKQFFGVVFLGLAIYFLQPLVPDSLSMLLWSALAVISGFWVFALKARSGGPAPAPVRAAGLLTLVYGIILLIGVAAGSNDPLQPLGTLRVDNRSGGAEAAAKQPALAFDTIKSLDDLNKRLSAAVAAGRPVMLDFYADWCTSCKEMERYTFSDKSVQDALSNAVLLHADVTKNDATDQQLLHHFGIFGPPTIAFYGSNGEERANYRVVGYMKAPEFANHAKAAFGG
jgi:thiol:disulfide interchange protein DsbD